MQFLSPRTSQKMRKSGKLLFAIFLGLFPSVCECNSKESKLINALLDGYDTRVRPVENSSDTVTVTMQATMKKLHDVDEARGEITTVMWLKLTWYDDFLTWHPETHGVDGPLRLAADSVWKPDIAVVNCLQDCAIRPHEQVLVESDGLVSMLASVTVTSSCHLYYGRFPFDEQECALVWGSLSYDGSLLDLAFDEVFKLDEFRWDVSWEVMGVGLQRRLDEAYDPKSDVVRSFPKLIMTVAFARLPRPYVISFLWPCFVFCLLILLQFLFSPESHERIVLSVGTLLMITIYGLFMTGVGSTPWRAVSFLGAYFICILLAAGAALVITVCVVNLYFKRYSQRRLKEQAQKIFLRWIPRLLCMESLPESKWRRKSVFKTTVRPVDKRAAAGAQGEELLDLTKERADRQAAAGGVTLGDMDGSSDEVRPVTEEFKVAFAWMELIKTVREIMFRIDKQLADERSEEWKFSAAVIDRAGFVVITVYLLGVHLALLIVALH